MLEFVQVVWDLHLVEDDILLHVESILKSNFLLKILLMFLIDFHSFLIDLFRFLCFLLDVAPSLLGDSIHLPLAHVGYQVPIHVVDVLRKSDLVFSVLLQLLALHHSLAEFFFLLEIEHEGQSPDVLGDVGC